MLYCHYCVHWARTSVHNECEILSPLYFAVNAMLRHPNTLTPHPTLPPPGMDLYFKRHDGCAVTCDDFLAAMADANGVDLSGIAGWYSQAGTPHLDVSTSFNAGEAGRIFPLKNGLDSERRPGGCIGLR